VVQDGHAKPSPPQSGLLDFYHTTKCLCGIFGTEQSALVVLFVEGFIQGAL
jgi:hypothetical protein